MATATPTTHPEAPTNDVEAFEMALRMLLQAPDKARYMQVKELAYEFCERLSCDDIKLVQDRVAAWYQDPRTPYYAAMHTTSHHAVTHTGA